MCASCHPAGGDDGLVWFIHTEHIPLKRRRTPHLANAHSSTAPFHWDGQHKAMRDLVRGTMTDLMAGDGLLVDVDSVQAYIDEMVHAPVLPATDPTAVARGKSLFQGAPGCATCHAGDDTTDNAMHAVLDPMSLSADDVIRRTNTPGLRGLFLRAPYLHDGRSRDLRDLLTRPDTATHGQKAGLSPSDIDDLAAYLNSL